MKIIILLCFILAISKAERWTVTRLVNEADKFSSDMDKFTNYHRPEIITELRYTNSGEFTHSDGLFIDNEMFKEIKAISSFT